MKPYAGQLFLWLNAPLLRPRALPVQSSTLALADEVNLRPVVTPPKRGDS
jgi:hypothetical protein